VISRENYFDAVKRGLPEGSKDWAAMYSSALGGIVKDPVLMAVPIDDHLVHRGHGVFDTCNVKKGKAYGLNFHLDRMFRSAKLARIEPKHTKEEYRDLVLATIAASGFRDNVFVRYWLSVGRGDFNVFPNGFPSRTAPSEFYCMVHRTDAAGASDETSEVLVEETEVPFKPIKLATMKSNNYMLNALTSMSALERGGNLGIGVNTEGYLTECAVKNVAVVTPDGVLKTPPFHNILHGTTLQRALDLEADFVDSGVIKRIEQVPVHQDELKTCQEIIIFGGGNMQAVVSLNGQPVGTGSKGPVFDAMASVIRGDMFNDEHLDEIPF